jgi:hypothetical protein
VIRLLKRLLALASSLLVIFGVALIGYGVFYWLMGFPYPVVALLAFSAYGSFLLGVGLFVRLPETTKTLALATAAFSLSAALMLIVNVMSPPAIVLVVIAGAGALASYLRLRILRHRSR